MGKAVREGRLEVGAANGPPAGGGSAGLGTWLRRLPRRPLFQYLTLGAVLFALWVTLRPDPRPEIVVDRETVEAVAAQRRQLLGRPLSEDERRELISDLVVEEVLLREALRHGLERETPQVRRQLVASMLALLDSEIPEPSHEELEAYFHRHSDRYGETELERIESTVLRDWRRDQRDEQRRLQTARLVERYRVRTPEVEAISP